MAALLLALLGDWGGSPIFPLYTTPQQLLNARAMAEFASASSVTAVLTLGDNFYNLGICSNGTLAPYNNSCPNTTSPLTGTAQDPRFRLGFEDVYGGGAGPPGAYPSSSPLPFYIIAGNHDALGNVSASIAYTALSPGGQWRHPDFYYRLEFSAGPNSTVEVFMVDTTICYGIWSDAQHAAQCAAQLAWLEAGLAASRAAYSIVAGHYPIWSPCSHGNTQWAIDALMPLLVRYNVTAYLSGHDHCGAFMAPPTSDASAPGADLVFLVQGMGDGCCYNESNILAIPSGSLKYLLSQGYSQGAPSGFSVLEVSGGGERAASAMSFSFYSAAGGTAALLYTSPLLLPRTPLRDNSTGAVISMAAPNYRASGLPRPSAVAPFAPYPQAVRGAEAASFDFEAAHAHAVQAGGNASEIVVWLYAPTATNATWANWFTDLRSHRANVTGVAPCSYLVDSAGAFISQMPSPAAAAQAANWTRRMNSELGLDVLPLIAASGVGMNTLIRSGNGAAAAAFIADTVAELRALGGAGYNLQLEEPGNATIKAEWEAFLGAWADALAPSTISVIIGGDCRGKDWMFMDCGDYKLLQRNHSNVRAVTEATYEKEPAAWKDFEENIVRGLGLPVAQLGLEYGPPLLNPGNGCLPLAKAAGVRTLYVWVDTPAGTANQTAWDAFGWWLA
jgi:tartrate-resistant acid phosphatase type 5